MCYEGFGVYKGFKKRKIKIFLEIKGRLMRVCIGTLFWSDGYYDIKCKEIRYYLGLERKFFVIKVLILYLERRR